MQEAANFSFLKISDAIRTGDRLTYFSVTQGTLISGVVVSHSYGAVRGQHTFTVEDVNGSKHLVKGRNLYPRLTRFEKASQPA